MDLLEFPACQLSRVAEDLQGFLVDAKMKLFQAPIAITPDTPVADFDAVECDYAGYLAQTLGTLSPLISSDGRVYGLVGPEGWQPSDGTIPNGVWGFYVTNLGGTVLYFAGLLNPAPFPLNNELNFLNVYCDYQASDELPFNWYG